MGGGFPQEGMPMERRAQRARIKALRSQEGIKGGGK